MRILLLTRYSRMGASSRLRCLQYIPFLASHDVEVVPVPLFNDEYLENLYRFGRRNIKNVIWCYLNRVRTILTQRKYDLLWIQYELFPWLPDWIEQFALCKKIPYVVDFDDAMFHSYNLSANVLVRTLLQNKIENIMRRASVVVAGNKYLARHASMSGARRVEIIPTVIDLDRYQTNEHLDDGRLTIGWIGSPKTAHYLDLIKPALRQFGNNRDVLLSVVGIDAIEFGKIKVQCYPWSEASEVRYINGFDIGIMPLLNTPWEQGKCGYKLIQYMACAKPVVASAVGANKEIVRQGLNGFLADSIQEWIRAFSTLHANVELRKQMGQTGRQRVRDEYCLQVTGPKLLSIFERAG